VRVERLLQVNIVTLTVLGTLLLSVGQRVTALPLWVLIAALSSLWLTDVTGWFRLNRTATNIAAAVAVVLSFGELSQFRGGIQILAVANLLVYLQVILLFQKKEFRTYWQLAVLSLLQVIVAAAFNQGFSFGLLLVIYLFVGVSALALFFLHREGSVPDRVEDAPAPPAAAGGRWPLSGQRAAFVGSQHDARSGLGGELLGRLVKITGGTLVLTLLLFFVVPRLGSGAWYGTSLSPLRAVGFSDRVTLGELGKIIENPEEVLRIQFVDDATGEPYEVAGSLYVRGAVLNYYRKGKWSTHKHSSRGFQEPLRPADVLSRVGAVRQKITIEPMDRRELFCVWPFLSMQRDNRVMFNYERQRLVRPGMARRRFSFELGTTALAGGVQKPIVPCGQRVETAELLDVGPADEIPELIRLAGRWSDESGLPTEDRLARARLLEHMLRDSGQFEYSLQGQVRELGIDPVEDFIKNNPRGHCEYFATALVLMLRSQGIPARLVVGFKTNEWNRLGEFLQVRQLHAHTWVEAHLDPRHVPPELFLGDRPWQWAAGGWLRLDPTPTARDLRLESGSSLMGKVGSYFDWLDYVWDSYVMEMDSPRQREAVYAPVAETVKRIVRTVADRRWWRELFRAFGDSLRSRFRGLFRGLWRGGLTIVTAAVVLILGYGVCRWALRRFLGRLTGQVDSGQRGDRGKVEFYRRLEAVLARFGLWRAASQTQREFAREAGVKLGQSTGEHRLVDLPGEVAEAFYRVRFGGTPLDRNQAQSVEEALRALAQASDKR